MDFDFLTMMAYLIVAITTMTMIFGLLAYSVYKTREIKRVKKQHLTKQGYEKEEEEKIKYLFFEHKEIKL